MADLIEYTVARAHQGDRLTDDGTEVHLFEEGDTRLADPSVVAPLVKLGVLVDPAAAKTDDAPAEDKSEGDSTETKVDRPTPTKTPAPVKAPAKKAE